jgi:hypothetical protein
MVLVTDPVITGNAAERPTPKRIRTHRAMCARKSFAALNDSSASALLTIDPLRMMLSRRFADRMKLPQNGCA